MASATSSRLSREEFRKAKELEELRKTGAAPPALDETGQIINPHIPQYIASAPWYFNQTRPGLKHQYPSKFKPSDYSNDQSINEAPRHTLLKERVSEFRPGACANCGSMTHKVKDCLERPRARQAKHGAPVIGVNEKIIQKDLSFDAKRDRWAGYQPTEYQAVVQRHEKEEVARKKKKLQELEEQLKLAEMLSAKSNDEHKSSEQTNSSSQSSNVNPATSESNADPDSTQSNNQSNDTESAVDKLKRLKRERKLARLRKKVLEAAGQAPEQSNNQSNGDDTSSDSSNDDEDMKDYGEVITKMDAKSRTTVRNLRIREDTAKYLRNLDPKSAYYDPKSRSMRDNPYPDKSPDEVLYAGDNFLRQSGEVQEINKLQRYVWELNEKSNSQSEIEIHATALPSAAEKMFIAHQQKESEAKVQAKQALLAEYGSVASGLSSNAALHPAANMSVNDHYVEFDSEGRIISQQVVDEKPIVRSRFEEDVYDPGHSSVWGSFFNRETQKWGYACCHQTLRRCICVGEKGKQSKDLVNQPVTSISNSNKRKLENLTDEQPSSRLRT